MNGRKREELLWRLFRTFFRSRARFYTLFDRYEESVLEFADRFKTHRTRLKLPVDELHTLLDFKSLEELRDREILLLKETAHEIFRSPDSTDLLDHHVSNIYHEISMLKEEHYTLREEYLRSDQREYDRFFREVSEFYPKRLRHVRNLYAKALRRLEALLPELAAERILTRSLYLYGDELLSEHYPRGLAGLYRKMYPQLGALQAYREVGLSFFESGFEEEALQAFRKAVAAGRAGRGKKVSPAARKLLAEVERRIAALESSLSVDSPVS